MKKQGSIKNKLLIIILLTNLIVSAIVYFSSVYWLVENQRENRVTLANTITQAVSQNLAKLIYTSEISTASEITAQLKSFPKIKSMLLYDKNSKVIYQYLKESSQLHHHNRLIKANHFIERKGDNLKIINFANYLGLDLGYIEFNFKVESVFCIIEKNIFAILLFLFFLIILSYTMAVYFASKFTAPILKLVEFLATINLLELDKKSIATEENNEFLILYEEVNELLQKIASSNELQKIASVAFEIENGMIIVDENYKVLQVNKAYTAITGYSFDDVKDALPPVLQYMSPIQYKQMSSQLKSQHHWSQEVKNKIKNGQLIDERLSIFTVLDNEGNMIYSVLSFLDITEQKELQNRLKYLQRYDSLTGLINRDFLVEEFNHMLSKIQNDKFSYVLAFNLKDFKLINSAYGREYGDLVLQRIVQKIQEKIDEDIIFSRTNADEFIIIFEKNYTDKTETTLQAKLMAEFIVSLFAKGLSIYEQKIHTTPYIGANVYSTQEKDATIILKEVEIAINTAKKNNVMLSMFNTDLENQDKIEIDIYSNLLNALKNNEFELYYQLQYTDKEEPYAAEALIRWNHPKKGLISPVLFIPIAEKTGLISEIGRWVIKEAALQLNVWQKSNITKDWKLSINIGANHFKEEDFTEQVIKIFQENSASFENLKIELTEYVMLKNIDDVSLKMLELKALGIMLSLDDFGTGFSSLQYLQSLPIDQVKIDQTFVMNMFKNSSNIHIIEALTMLCNSLNLEIIAEGVEDKKSYEKLKSLGCKHYQGYYFAKPEKWSSIKTLLKI